jgi:preprotein translocase subunit SecB
MQITLENTFVRELTVHASTANPSTIDERFFKVNFDKIFHEEEDAKEFTIRFKVKVSNPNEFDINIVYDCLFNTDSVIDNDFKESHFPNINAPAIAYPFLRSYVSFLTLNSGFEPAILPTINFTSFAQQPKDLSENSII